MANFWQAPGAFVAETGSDGYVSSLLGAINETSAAGSSDTISISEIAQYRVFEGAAGSAQVTISGTHTGATDTIQYRIENLAGEGVTAWAQLQSGVAEGAFSATVSIPRGGWYLAAVRKAGDPGVVATQTQRWGVGYVVGGMGQSQLGLFGVRGTGTPDARAVIHDGTSWALMTPTGEPRNVFCSTLIAAADCPVAYITSDAAGSAMSNWWNAGKTTSYNNWEAKITASGGKLSAFIWWQGEADALLGRSKAAYKADMDAMFAQLRADYGATLPVAIANLGRTTDSVTDAAWEAIRDAHVDASNDPYNSGFVVYDAALSDSVHLTTASYVALAPRIAHCVGKAYGDFAFSRGPLPANATRIDATTVDIAIAHDGGTDFTPTTGITGFEAFDGGAPATISSVARHTAAKVRITLASAPTGALTIRYGYGKSPVISNVLRDNSALALPLVTTDADLLAAGRRVVLDCIQREGGAPAASVTGLRWAFFDQSAPNALTAPVATGTGELTDGSGVLEIDVLGTSLGVGDTGYLVTDTAAGVGFCGPVQVSG